MLESLCTKIKYAVTSGTILEVSPLRQDSKLINNILFKNNSDFKKQFVELHNTTIQLIILSSFCKI